MKSPQDMHQINIDITNACIYQCSNCTRFCGHHTKNFFMDYETFKRAVDSMEGFRGTVSLIGGEPTLHPEFERFAHYLKAHVSVPYKNNHKPLIAPQKDFIESILLENKVNSEVYDYGTYTREVVPGAGLLSAIGPTYKKHYELIQDTFRQQQLNDHGGDVYHSPVLINRKDFNISDEEWVNIRDHCWVNDIWSATITPKGAFFCEIAGSLDMLFDGPGGWPIEKEWWKRTPDQFGDQLQWCEYCGMALETFSRKANDSIDDVSESMYRKLVEIGSPKLKKEGAVNIVKFENGKIAKNSIVGTCTMRKSSYIDNLEARFNKSQILYPTGFDVIVDCGEKAQEDLIQWVARNSQKYDSFFVINKKGYETQSIVEQSKVENIICIEGDDRWGHGFASALAKCHGVNPIVYLDDMVDLSGCLLDEFADCVLNPGTLFIMNPSKGPQKIETEGGQKIAALFHKNAISLSKIGMDRLYNATCFMQIVSMWDQTKTLSFDTSVIEDRSYLRIRKGQKYAVFGTSTVGKRAYHDINKIGSEVVMFVDSDESKWGSMIEEIECFPPKKLLEKKSEYDKIVIAKKTYKRIIQTLFDLGFSEKDYIIHE